MALKNKSLSVRLTIFAAIVLVLIIGMRMVTSMQQSSTKHQGLAQCLKQKEVKFYGAFWCTHCADQKKAFGASATELPYVECSNPDHSQNEACTAAGVDNKYPTWIFPDGTKHEGGLKPAQLASMSGCSVN